MLASLAVFTGPLKGMTSLETQSIKCTEGYICDFNTTSGSQFDFMCPAGLWCDYESKPQHLGCVVPHGRNPALPGEDAKMWTIDRLEVGENMETPDDAACDCFDTGCDKIDREDGKRCYCPIGLCPAGSICYRGTKRSQWDRSPCKPGYFCPEGTPPVNITSGFNRCPNGTTSDQGATRKEDCYRDGEAVGYLTSGNYGHHLGRAIGLGYVTHPDGVTADWVKAGTYEIEVACERVAARASLRPFYDPKSERVKL